jgi:cytoskeleton protein RodZ
MTNMTHQIGGTEMSHIPLGAKLQSAREAMRMDRKDAASQLRLSENVIDMIENNSFPDTMPPIFVRGYIRSYGKFLQVSDDVVQAGLEPIQPKQVNHDSKLAAPVTQMPPLYKANFLMKSLTAAIAITLLWLVAAWWHSKNTANGVENIAANLRAETSESADASANSPSAYQQQNVNASVAPLAPTPFRAANPTSVGNINADAGNPIFLKEAAKTPKAADSSSIPAYKRADMVEQTTEQVATNYQD